uniref:Uncharacterized protein n=1 Tax=Mus musculus TaxID=10090 RepID=Q3U5D4_MOUSE|nr:unnamed protein product [Mus musculus]
MHSGAGLLKAQNIHICCTDPVEVTAWTHAFINALQQAHGKSRHIRALQNFLRAGEMAPPAKVLRAKPGIMEGENCFLRLGLRPPHSCSGVLHAHTLTLSFTQNGHTF